MNKWFAAAAAAVLAVAFSQSSQAETTLRLTLQLPIQHHLGKNVTAFKEEVEKETGGEIKVEIYPSAQLYKDSEVPQAVASGAIEMGVASIAQFAGTIPAVDIFYVPFMFPTTEIVEKATKPGSTVRGPIDDAVLKSGARVLWWQAYGGTVFLSKKDPIVVPADLKNMKVRVFGKTLGEFVKVVGGSPTMISGSEQILAYQRGTVDAGMTGVTAVKSRKLYEVMNHLTMTNLADIEFLVLINDKVWKGLTADQQAILTKAAQRVEKELRDTMTGLEKDALEFVRDKIKVVELDDAQVDAWKKASAPVVDVFIENAGPLGKQLVDAANALK